MENLDERSKSSVTARNKKINIPKNCVSQKKIQKYFHSEGMDTKTKTTGSEVLVPEDHTHIHIRISTNILLNNNTNNLRRGFKSLKRINSPPKKNQIQ